MNVNLKNILKTSFLFLMLSPVQPIFAAPQIGYSEMPITGKTNINVMYDVDDTKSIMNYSGVKYYKICDEYTVSSSGKTYTCNVNDFKAMNWNAVTDANGVTINTPVNLTSSTDKLGVKNFVISTEEGVHNICIQTKDAADNGDGTGNISDLTCREIYYDKTGPEVSSIVINGGNHWINTGKIPVTMKISDNRAGIGKITYDTGNGTTAFIDFSKTENTIKCTHNTHEALGDGSYTCTITAFLETNEYRHYGDLNFKIIDRVGNVTNVTECPGSYVDTTGKGSCRVYYDLKDPIADANLLNSGNGSINNSTGHLEYHIKDEPDSIWKSPSGIEQVIVENSDGSNKQWLVDERNNPDPSKTVDGILRDYLFNKCPASAKFTIIDKAGNITEYNTEQMACNVLGIYEFRVTDVVNPTTYNLSSPFEIREWDFTPNPIILQAAGGFLGPVTPTYEYPYGDLPKALAGANMTFDMAYIWDGDPISSITGYYTIEIYNKNEGYLDSWTVRVTDSNFKKAETVTTDYGTEGVVYRMYPETFMIPKDAPSTNAIRDSYTYVTIRVSLTITTYEGEIVKTQARIFPLDNSAEYAHIGLVVGNIDDYLWFSELS